MFKLKYVFSTIKMMEDKYMISLKKVNEYLKIEGSQDYFQKYKQFISESYRQIENSIKFKTEINRDCLETVILSQKFMNTSETQKVLQLSLLSEIEKKGQYDDLIQVTKFDRQLCIDVLIQLKQWSVNEQLKFLKTYSDRFMILKEVSEPDVQAYILNFLGFIIINTQNAIKVINPITPNNLGVKVDDQDRILWKGFDDKNLDDLVDTLLLKLTWEIKKGYQFEHRNIDGLVNSFLTHPKFDISFEDIIIQEKLSFNQQVSLGSKLKQQDDIDLQRFYQYLKQKEAIDKSLIFKLFLQQRKIDQNILKEVEESPLNLNSPYKILMNFYSLVPSDPPWNICQIINRNLVKKWNESLLNNKLQNIQQIFRIEKLLKSPQPNQKYMIIDNILLNLINETILQLKVQNLTNFQKLQVYFIFNTYFSSEMLSPQFNTMQHLYISSYLRQEFEKQERNESYLQYQVGESLKKLGFKYQQEQLIQNCFSVDFLIDDKVIEVNGPSHYYEYWGDQHNPIQMLTQTRGIYESKKTQLKVIFNIYIDINVEIERILSNQYSLFLMAEMEGVEQV
ncbi:hypothetical protein pb186bvf_009443 [Paramecium bursaria]